jgi:hypothetical protein
MPPNVVPNICRIKTFGRIYLIISLYEYQVTADITQYQMNNPTKQGYLLVLVKWKNESLRNGLLFSHKN